MTVAWSLTSQEIIQDALEHLQVLAAGETPSSEDNAMAITALQNILKELPMHGLNWPKITVTPAALTWSSGTPAQVSMPVDYFGSPVISFTQNSANVDLEIITKAEYDAIQQPAYVALYPQKVYIAPSNVGYLWPVPSADPVMSIVYQAIVSDASLTVTPDVMQLWKGGMGLWVAFELIPKFSVPADLRSQIENRFMLKKKLMLAYAAETAQICFTVAD